MWGLGERWGGIGNVLPHVECPCWIHLLLIHAAFKECPFPLPLDLLCHMYVTGLNLVPYRKCSFHNVNF